MSDGPSGSDKPPAPPWAMLLAIISGQKPSSGGDMRPRPLLCSFCGKGQHQVERLIAGPAVYICNECVDLCAEIIAEEREQAERSDPPER